MRREPPLFTKELYTTVAEKDTRVLLLSCDFSRILRSRNERFYVSHFVNRESRIALHFLKIVIRKSRFTFRKSHFTNSISLFAIGKSYFAFRKSLFANHISQITFRKSHLTNRISNFAFRKSHFTNRISANRISNLGRHTYVKWARCALFRMQQVRGRQDLAVPLSV